MMKPMSWDVENTDEFGSWFADLSETDQDAIRFSVGLLMAQGPNLRFPHSSGISNSRHSHLRELRVQSEGRPLRVFYAFDPRRSAILLIGGQDRGRPFLRSADPGRRRALRRASEGTEAGRIVEMSGHRPFADLMKDWSPERRARSDARQAELAAEMVTLEQLREGLGISQEELANLMEVQQPAISKLVRRTDMKVSTLRDLIAAMGGELHITATFSDRSVEIGNFTASAV
jgi:predicted XRE-type DNA-binding protein